MDRIVDQELYTDELYDIVLQMVELYGVVSKQVDIARQNLHRELMRLDLMRASLDKQKRDELDKQLAERRRERTGEELCEARGDQESLQSSETPIRVQIHRGCDCACEGSD